VSNRRDFPQASWKSTKAQRGRWGGGGEDGKRGKCTNAHTKKTKPNKKTMTPKQKKGSAGGGSFINLCKTKKNHRAEREGSGQGRHGRTQRAGLRGGGGKNRKRPIHKETRKGK